MSIAHYFTFVRILISPIFLLLYILHDSLGISHTLLPYILIILLGLSELSDACDGYLARKYNQVTDLGKILDPMADSISRLTVFLTFTQPPVNLPIALVFLFLYRDSVVSTLRTICALKGFALAARPSGKLKAAIQAVTAFIILGMMIPESMGTMTEDALQFWSTWLTAFAAAYTVYSGIDYIYANREFVTRLLKLPPQSSN